MVRALASHQCVPGSIRSGIPIRSNSIGNSRATGLSVEDCYVLPSLNKAIYLFIYLLLKVYIGLYKLLGLSIFSAAW